VTQSVRIKNTSETARSIRPYTDRGELVTAAPGEIVSIDLKRCGFDIRTNPGRYFKSLGFVFDPAPEPVQKRLETAAIKPVEPIKTEKSAIDEPSQSAPVPTAVKVTPDKVRIGIEGGDIMHFHPGNRLWHTVRIVKDRLVGKLVYNVTDKTYFKVLSIDGDLLVSVPITEADALKAAGVAP